VSHIEEGTFENPSTLAVRLAQENSGGRVAIGDFFDIHGYTIAPCNLDVNTFQIIYMGTLFGSNIHLSSMFTVRYDLKSVIFRGNFRLAREELRLQSLFARPRAERLKPQLPPTRACTLLAF
jgi:hypothetical protein